MVYLPSAILVPYLYGKVGIRRTVSSHAYSTPSRLADLILGLHWGRCVCCISMDPLRRSSSFLVQKWLPRSHCTWTSEWRRTVPYHSADPTTTQILAAFSVPIFQVIVPSYSERWFDLRGRTTATMIMGLGTNEGYRVAYRDTEHNLQRTRSGMQLASFCRH